ncbi:hypothetical protein [Nonomuraea rubra]|uniref:Uncharacterized protein n=1 Tax=Nonomuraea rubra TaxID=46180 RepID=A0A7X0TWY1_9ACTN|nr:hypothetical protein [Nonomuraea rubra]MBB6547007.1 hypothetical protein [Nonomuraea rubra]
MAAIHRVEASPGSRTLVVTVFGDATQDGKLCTAVASAKADEAPNRVDVKIVLRDVCPVTLPIWEANRRGFGSTALQEVEVVLQHPLGGREVFDAQGSRIFNVVRGKGVGAKYCVSSCDLGVFVEEAAESVSSGDLDVGVDWIGWRPLT